MLGFGMLHYGRRTQEDLQLKRQQTCYLSHLLIRPVSDLLTFPTKWGTLFVLALDST